MRNTTYDDLNKDEIKEQFRYGEIEGTYYPRFLLTQIVDNVRFRGSISFNSDKRIEFDRLDLLLENKRFKRNGLASILFKEEVVAKKKIAYDWLNRRENS